MKTLIDYLELRNEIVPHARPSRPPQSGEQVAGTEARRSLPSEPFGLPGHSSARWVRARLWETEED